MEQCWIIPHSPQINEGRVIELLLRLAVHYLRYISAKRPWLVRVPVDCQVFIYHQFMINLFDVDIERLAVLGT